MALSGPLIWEKAKLLHGHLSGMGGVSMSAVGTTGNSSPFTAWFHCFKARYNLHNIKPVGERASADHYVAKAFPAELASLIKEKGYLPEQVTNADETGLCCR